MTTSSEKKVVFMSQEWFAAACDILNDLAARHGKPGESFSLCERFTGVPASISPSGATAWHFRLKGNSVEAGMGEIDDADINVTADYEATLPMARLVYTAENVAQRQAHAEKHPSKIEGDVSRVPGYLAELHNRLAVLTA